MTTTNTRYTVPKEWPKETDEGGTPEEEATRRREILERAGFDLKISFEQTVERICAARMRKAIGC